MTINCPFCQTGNDMPDDWEDYVHHMMEEEGFGDLVEDVTKIFVLICKTCVTPFTAENKVGREISPTEWQEMPAHMREDIDNQVLRLRRKRQATLN